MAKALFVFDHKFPLDNTGKYCYSSGFDQEFFSRYFNIFDQFNVFGRVINVNEGAAKPIDVSLYPTNITTVVSNKNLAAAYSVLKNEIINHDCVVSRMPSLLGTLAINICKRINKPYIVEVVACTYDALANSPSWKRRFMATPAETIYRYVLRNNPYNVYVTKEFLQKKYPTKGSQIACSNVTLYETEESVLEERLSKIDRFDKSKKIVLGTTSTLNVDFKGQKYVIQALPELIKKGYNIEYQLVGDGDGSWLLDIAKDLGVEDYVKIIGRLNHDDVFKWLDNIDVYVHPSCQEGLSRAIIEAMSRACPIVGADTGGIHELIQDEYIVPKKDVSSITEAIQFVINGDLKSIAYYNFVNSKEYVKSTLYRIREEYFKEFLKNNNLV